MGSELGVQVGARGKERAQEKTDRERLIPGDASQNCTSSKGVQRSSDLAFPPPPGSYPSTEVLLSPHGETMIAMVYS